MIASLRGTVLSIAPPDSLVMEVGGVGYHVRVPASTLSEVGAAGRPAFLHTHLIVREDGFSLYGFSAEDQRALFELLLTVQGVGPRLALSILSSLSPDVLRRAVAHEQPEVFARVRGVGRKIAEKVVFTLKDRLAAEPALGALAQAGEVDTEVIAALTALGYSVVEAQAAVQSIPRESDAQTVEDRVRLALGYFARP